jgi:hypothetical protein
VENECQEQHRDSQQAEGKADRTGKIRPIYAHRKSSFSAYTDMICMDNKQIFEYSIWKIMQRQAIITRLQIFDKNYTIWLIAHFNL